MSERTPPSESELVEMVRSIDVRAPQRLHDRIDAMVAERAGARARRPALRWGLAAAVPAVCALALVLSGGGSSLTLENAVALTLRPATMPAPGESARGGGELTADVEGVAFPYWEESRGWRATGERVDRVDGRMVTTVFYADGGGRRLGYAIVAGTPAPSVHGGVLVRRDGVAYRLTLAHGARVVTWLRDGRLCVLAARDVSRRVLLSLASWRGNGASTS
ncbi:MAG TPA: hypothetical protein VKV16_06450 [Solirubrobacteraceae bacterium]|nr:hypothetical protein [Solirubrobacteraceae bacterium]